MPGADPPRRTPDEPPRDSRRLAGDLRRAGAATRRSAATSGRVARRAAVGTARGVRQVTHARGAGESGLARVMELHAVSSAADALIVTALASTIFFSVPTDQARSRVALSLAVTMVPFTLLAPLIGPLLDRVRHGRRYALGATMVVRAFLAWVMAGAVSGAGGHETAFSLYPAAFGFLVCQKAYLVTRAAAVPRVLPPGIGLVGANSRISLAGVAGMALGAPLGAGLTVWIGPQWTLRLAFGVFAAGTALALALPGRVDSSEGEMDARMSSSAEPDGRPGSWSIGARVVLGLRANAALRAFTGFLTLFLAFRLRTEPLGGLGEGTAVVLVIVVASVGGGLGTALGALLRRVRAETVVVLVLALVAITSGWAALAYGLWPVMAIALAAGLAQGLGKLCLDALIQREVPDTVRTSAFARSETVLQLAWVLGGGVGLVLPLSGPWGLGVACVTLAVVTGTALVSLRRLPATAAPRKA
jgi:MFS family permease